MIRRIYKGMVYTEVSRANTNVIIAAHCPSWWTYKTGMTIPIDVWDACPDCPA